MNLAPDLSDLVAAKQTDNLTLAEHAEFCCRIAKQLEKAGEYEQAHEALAEFWSELDKPPKLEGLDRARG